MGTTTNLDLPYPEGTDLVISGDDAIQALAEAVDNRLAPDASLTVAMGESPKAVGGATAVDFPGTTSAGGFTNSAGEVFTYTGTEDRFFMVAASVEISNGPAGGTSVSSTVYLQQNGTNIWSSYDQVSSAAAGVLQSRNVVHHLVTPVQLGPGDTIAATAYASPAGTIGTTSLRIYPIGPKLS